MVALPVGHLDALRLQAQGALAVQVLDFPAAKSALREAKGELKAATGRTALNTAARKLMWAKAELKRLAAENPA